MSEELKPCPFCGKQPYIKDLRDFLAIVCPEGSPCRESGLAVMFYAHESEKALATWNTRAPADREKVYVALQALEGGE